MAQTRSIRSTLFGTQRRIDTSYQAKYISRIALHDLESTPMVNFMRLQETQSFGQMVSKGPCSVHDQP